jgi:hypothetical protein
MNYLPDDYESVEQRIRNFYADHPQGRITTDIISLDSESVTFRASVYRDLDPDPSPAATGHAHGLLTKPKAVEFIETVSIGRALANLNYAKQGARASQEEMQAFDEVKHNVGNSRGPQAKQRASEPITEKQLPTAKRLLGEVDDAVNIVTEHLGEYRPPEVWSKYEASGDRGQDNGLISKLIAAKEAQMGGKKKVTRSTGQDDWHLVEAPSE